MSYGAARQVEPEVLRVQSGDGYQRIPDDPIYPPLDNGRIDRLRNCLIIQGIVIAVLIAAFLIQVLSFGVVLSNFRSPVNTNSSASHHEILHNLSCIEETPLCHFSRNKSITTGETNSPCTTSSLSTDAKVCLYLA